MCAEKFPLVSMGGRADRQACADGERGPPSARAEINLFGPSEVRATSGQHLGGHYFAYINLFLLLLSLSLLLPPLFKTTEGVVVGFQIFAWAPKKK